MALCLPKRIMIDGIKSNWRILGCTLPTRHNLNTFFCLQEEHCQLIFCFFKSLTCILSVPDGTADFISQIMPKKLPIYIKWHTYWVYSTSVDGCDHISYTHNFNFYIERAVMHSVHEWPRFIFMQRWHCCKCSGLYVGCNDACCFCPYKAMVLNVSRSEV